MSEEEIINNLKYVIKVFKGETTKPALNFEDTIQAIERFIRFI